jgi:vancomycin resistance protein YoaR
MPQKKATRSKFIMTATMAIPIAILLFWWWNKPFEKTLVTQSASLRLLSKIQRQNIAIAAQRLNGDIIEPGERFSFNEVVGPRTARRGYQAAPSYIADGSPKTLGGGICLLSSAVYNLALKAGFKIDERHAHLRPVKSVLPGLDAAIWYGQADMAFTNNSRQPVKLQAIIQDNSLKLMLLGKTTSLNYRLYPYQTVTPKGVFVEVQRKAPAKKAELISRDLYHP